MADNETITDVIAEMRGIRVREFQDYAERFEAAIKRERAKIEADALAVGGMVEAERKCKLSKDASKNVADFGQLGDAAKLREALKRAWLFVSATRESFAFVHEGRIERDKLCDDIDAALSAPPRNCERFQTVKQAKEAYCAEVRRVYIWDGCETERLVDWLLAPAMEQKGDNDGNE